MVGTDERYDLVVIPYSTANAETLNDQANHVWSEFRESTTCSEILNPLLGSQIDIAKMPNPFVIEPYESGFGASEIAYIVLGALASKVADAAEELAKELTKELAKELADKIKKS
jgi:hypothetical protein